jgi:hypothetical protein
LAQRRGAVLTAAASLLAILRDAGLTVAADGDMLIIGPRELLTDELRATIREHKHALLAELPRYRWLVTGPDVPPLEVCCLPELTEAEMRGRYPGATMEPLPDAPVDAAI